MTRTALVMLLLSATAAADPVAVKVIDVAGGAAYLTPGRAAGIVPGTRVRLRGVDAVVVEVTENTAMVRIGSARVALGDAGTANATPGAVSTVTRRPRPRPLETFTGQWSAPVLPATQQRPHAVPLVTETGPGGARVTVIGHAFGVAGGDRTAGHAEGRVIATFDVMADRLAADLDVAARLASGGSTASRTRLFVRAAQLRYGNAGDERLAVGRLRAAAALMGTLDGARVNARIGSLELAGFGGFVPDPLSGKPDTSAARFGGELSYDAPSAAWQPRVSLAAHGSTWNGRLDERRLSIAASTGRAALWLVGWAEAQSFASDNPWRARAVELTGAGASAAWRERGTHAGFDVTFLRPERSLRLAARLPPEWLCTLAPGTVEAEARCASGDSWASATGSFGTRTARWAIDAVGTLGRSRGVYRGLERSGYARGELRAGTARLITGLAGGSASFASWTAGELGAAYVPTPAFDITLTYRPELLDYGASTELVVMHSVLADLRFAISTAYDLALSTIGTVGADRDTLAVFATLVWRPLP